MKMHLMPLMLLMAPSLPGFAYSGRPPDCYVDRLYNVTHWCAMSAGGHFAALEQPDMPIEDVRRFARSLKQESD